MIDLEKLDQLEAAATPGPWAHGTIYDGDTHLILSEKPGDYVVINDDEAEHNDMEFIAEMRNSIPFILRRLRAADKVIHEWKNQMAFGHSDFDEALKEYEDSCNDK